MPPLLADFIHAGACIPICEKFLTRPHLADIDTQARNKLHLLVKRLAEKEGINEQLKSQDQMAWVAAMNNIRNRAEEIVLQELIYGEDAV